MIQNKKYPPKKQTTNQPTKGMKSYQKHMLDAKDIKWLAQKEWEQKKVTK